LWSDFANVLISHGDFACDQFALDPFDLWKLEVSNTGDVTMRRGKE
jgi:hypothetical protein